MKLFDILKIHNPNVQPKNSKIHLAGWNGTQDPLDLYLRGEFDEWQRWQSRRNFSRDYVVSLIKLKDGNSWLFAGVHKSAKPVLHNEETPYYRYPLEEDLSFRDLNGRLVVSFSRPGRQSYLNSEKWIDNLIVEQLFKRKMTVGDFPGFKSVNLSFDEMKMIVNQSLSSWRSALSSVAGVYLITDASSGKLYVGSATGEGGIWQRWCSYAENGHGGNTELQKLVSDNGAKNLRYSILEIADTHASYEEIIQRESHWKTVLMTRDFGLNLN